MSGDELLAEFLPKLRGYIAKHYAWTEKRGNCLVTVDDLTQIASIRLLKLADGWEETKARITSPIADEAAVFWSYLKLSVKQAVYGFYNAEGGVNPDWSKPSEREQSVGLTATSEDGEFYVTDEDDYRAWAQTPQDSIAGKFTLLAVADYFDMLPFKHKVILALRFYDEMSLSAMRQLGVITAGKGVTPYTDRWRDFARNQFTDHQVEIHRTYAKPWEPSAALKEYVQNRHRNDLHTYIGRVSIALHTDPVYLSRILSTDRYFAPGAAGGFKPLSPHLQQQIDRMRLEGQTVASIARTLGLGEGRVSGHLSRRYAVV